LEAEIGLLLLKHGENAENVLEIVRMCQTNHLCSSRILSKGLKLKTERVLEDKSGEKKTQTSEVNDGTQETQSTKIDAETEGTHKIQTYLGLTAAQLISAAMAILCVSCAAIAAGLTIGMMSLDPQEILIKERHGSSMENRMAKKVRPLIEKHHFLLVTLLLFNSLANESLPTFLDDLFPEYVAIFLSVSLVLLFGEILPSAIFTGPNKLKIVSKCCWFVKLLMSLLSPIAYPISVALDLFVPHEKHRPYSRDEIAAFLEMQQRKQTMAYQHLSEDYQHISEDLRKQSSLKSANHSGGTSNRATINPADIEDCLIDRIGDGIWSESRKRPQPSSFTEYIGCSTEYGLGTEELAMITGILNITHKEVAGIMRPIEKVFSLSDEDILDLQTLAIILASGYSRIPVYKGHDSDNIIGFILTKRLIVLSPEDCRQVKSLCLHKAVTISSTATLSELLHSFKKSRSHLALVFPPTQSRTKKSPMFSKTKAPSPKLLGIVTLDDVLVQFLQEEIVIDESDFRLSSILHYRQRGHELLRQCIKKFRQRKLQRKSCVEKDVMIQTNSVQQYNLYNSIQLSHKTTHSVQNYKPIMRGLGLLMHT